MEDECGKADIRWCVYLMSHGLFSGSLLKGVVHASLFFKY